ncbi:MAG: MBL fold metallo-hydrolase [Bacteroidia bacterium]|nr:MAG: MBL fold metallo-hydrolase [Bacteroidia bacterium]
MKTTTNPPRFQVLFIVLLMFAPVSSCSLLNIFDKVEPPFVYEVHFVDVGQGDAIYVVTPEKNVLIDGGRRNSGIVEYLQRLEVESIDLVIGTHPHADHVGGLIEVFHTFDVTEVIDPEVNYSTVTYRDYRTTIDSREITFTAGRSGMEWQLSEGAVMQIVHPAAPSTRHINDASVVARIVFGDIAVLLTGDAEERAEREMLARSEPLRSQILKVGHHGSITSTTLDFLEQVKPEVAVIMVGEGNRYAHPNEETLHNLEAAGAEIYRTDTHGSIVIKTNGIRYVIHTTSEETLNEHEN